MISIVVLQVLDIVQLLKDRYSQRKYSPLESQPSADGSFTLPTNGEDPYFDHLHRFQISVLAHIPQLRLDGYTPLSH